jgi:biotin transporter BioY
MLLSLLAAKPYLDKSYENFTDSSQEETMAVSVLTIVFFVIFTIISSYGAARLSYYYNMNTGNSGYAVMWSVLAFIFYDLYYPMYYFFLNTQSAKGRNNIHMPSAM